MRNNHMRFSDILIKQISCIAMGMSPAPTISNLFVAIDENINILQFLQTFLRYLRRLLMMVSGFDPIVDANNWTVFQAAVNNGGLEWTFSKRSQSVVFMDRDESVRKILWLCISTSLLTPATRQESCLASSLANSREKDIELELKLFFTRLLDCGYHSSDIPTDLLKSNRQCTPLPFAE
ncbi:hypothetical protein ACHAXR_000909 [Thalassiosira sp. AJA248-18]